MSKFSTRKARWILLALAILVVSLMIIRSRFFWMTMASTSMDSTAGRTNEIAVRANDDVLAIKGMLRFLKKGDLVVVELKTEPGGSAPTTTIRRVGGIPGDVLLQDANRFKIPNESYYLLGDSTNAIDSRELGLIEGNQIIGKVVWVMGRDKARH